MEDKKLQRITIVSILTVFFFAWQDITGYKMWKSLGGFASEAYTKAEPLYMDQFWGFAAAALILMALVYYLIRKDKSEALAVAIVPAILLWGGLEDILYYQLLNIPLDASMPWLWNNAPFMHFVAASMGLTTVTPTSLWVSFIASVFIAYFVYKWLVKQKW